VGTSKCARGDPRRALVARGNVCWLELASDGRRPVLVLTRDEAIPSLNAVVVALVTRTIRGIPTEVELGPADRAASERRNPPFAGTEPLAVLDEDALDRIGKQLDRTDCARATPRKQDQPRMGLTSSETFSCEGTEVLHVPGDHRSTLGVGGFQDQSVGMPSEVTAIANSFDVVATVSKQSADSGRQLLIEEHLHPRSARSPAAAASKPRRYSASLTSIAASISSGYSP